MRAFSMGLVMLLCASALTAQTPPDTFEIVLPPRGPGQESGGALMVEADGLTVPSGFGIVELRRGPSLVAVFPMHQVVLIANRSVRGERTFEVQTHHARYEISADRMQSGAQNGQILFWVGEELVGAVTPHQVLVVTDRSARVGPGRS